MLIFYYTYFHSRSSDTSGANSGNVTPPIPGYEREATGSYFSNAVHASGAR